MQEANLAAFSTQSNMKASTERKVLSIAQDIVFQFSGGRTKMPKNVGLGLAVRNLVHSKEIITMLNRNGHCINY